jgi:hypothetical protein
MKNPVILPISSLKRAAFFAIAGISFTACSTVPISIPIQSGTKIIIARDSGFLGSACDFTIRVDGKVEGYLSSGKILTIESSAGEHKVSAGTGTYSSGGASGLLCPNLTSSLIIEIKNQPVALRLGLGSNSQLFFERAE